MYPFIYKDWFIKQFDIINDIKYVLRQASIRVNLRICSAPPIDTVHINNYVRYNGFVFKMKKSWNVLQSYCIILNNIIEYRYGDCVFALCLGHFEYNRIVGILGKKFGYDYDINTKIIFVNK